MTNKVCLSCLLEKPVSEFYKSSLKKDAYGSRCKTCEKERYRSYYSRNKNTVASKKSKYRQENKDKHNEYCKKHYSLNKEEIRQKQKTHYEQNKPMYRQKTMLRYARKTQQTPKWLNKGHLLEMEGFYLFCQIFKGYQVDHIVPIRGVQVSGMHVPWNLQVLTAEQNRAKSNFFNELEYT